ncbi:MAG: hypothetical protein EBS84_22125 [Proteobacteria bacterium]|nr:hypothetical protein [Pseudomonadota bacterium]
MGLAVFALRAGLLAGGESSPLVIVTACVGTGVVVYGALLWLLKGYFWSEVRDELGRIFGARLGGVSAEV